MPPDGPLAALTTLLRGTHLAPPERVARAIDAAAQHLGVRAGIYLADHAQESLVPLAGSVDPQAWPDENPQPLWMDGTMGGLAYRRLESHTTTADAAATLWMPIIDGVERLGVLAITASTPTELEDPRLQRECWLLSHYLGHVLDAIDRYGDGLEAVRRRTPRNVAAELIWQLLPPLTAGTDQVLVSGRLEPSEAVGGDVFDYALSEEHADLFVLDATGHDLSAGLAAATALAAYRNARREGHGLFQRSQVVHESLVQEFGERGYATGAMADLDLGTGQLRYLAAGHPSPLVMRDGKVVKSLDDGRRPLFGIEATDVSLGEEQLEPGDIVVLYTDGIPEARDEAGREFGLDRLVDFLERQYTDGTPLPEVVRGLCKTILRYQHGVLQDDATVVLLHWTTEGQASLEPAPLP